MNRNFLTKNIELKITSLVLAIALWFFVILSGRTEITIDAPILFTNIPSKLEVVDSPPKVSISIEGQKRILKNLKQEEVSAVIDLGDTKEGRSFFTLSNDNFNLPKTLVVTSINPETVSLKLETQLKKTVPVKPYVVGLPEKGYTIEEIRVVPESISIEGPDSIIKKVRSIKTEPIDISGINNNLRFKANLNLPNTNTRADTNKVEVIISVREIK